MSFAVFSSGSSSSTLFLHCQVSFKALILVLSRSHLGAAWRVERTGQQKERLQRPHPQDGPGSQRHEIRSVLHSRHVKCQAGQAVKIGGINGLQS